MSLVLREMIEQVGARLKTSCQSFGELSHFIADSDDVIPWNFGGQMRNEATDASHKIIEGLSAR